MNDFKKTVEIIGGGTVSHVRTHMSIAAMAYGNTARALKTMCEERSNKLKVNLHLTKMANAGQGNLETNDDVADLVGGIIKDPNVKIVFFNPAMCDFSGDVGGNYPPSTTFSPYVNSPIKSGKYAERLSSSKEYDMHLSPSNKVINAIRKTRKDIFLVGSKTTCGVSADEQYLAGLNLLKTASCNLVLCNDVKTRKNIIITPEEARYHVTNDRTEALRNLVEMAYLRSHLTFTRSTVIKGEPVKWNGSSEIPRSLHTIVEWCIAQGAYKPFNGATVGHFAVKIGPTTFLTSRRKTNFNDLGNIGLVKIETDGPDSVLAYGSKPSVGGQSQRIVFEEHPEYDCIVHFHCPLRSGITHIPVVSQREYECGSHECGKNTSRGLKAFKNVEPKDTFSVVMLDNHGPNIVFNRSINPEIITKFIQHNFDLAAKTGGPVKL